MKCSLWALLLVACHMTGHRASAQYVEPPWWPLIQATFEGVDLNRCQRRTDPPPDGQKCSRKPKTCFFGLQDCAGGAPYPDTRCICNFRTWQCDPVQCPGTTNAPTEPPVSSQTCMEVVIDFETSDNGSRLAAGDYVGGTEWRAQYGIEVSATTTTGFTPNNRPRLFDTANPGTVDTGDPDMGSPNQLCIPPGPGIGAAGAPGAVGENCAAQGLVLIVQESDKLTPDDNGGGGMIIFDFKFPTNVKSVGLLDIEPGAAATFVSVTRTNGLVSSFNAQGLGDNSAQDVSLSVEDAQQVKITFATSGAVTYLDVCIESAEPSMAPSISRSEQPSVAPITTEPSMTPSISRSEQPSSAPTTAEPSMVPSISRSKQPSVAPITTEPSLTPSISRSDQPSSAPTTAEPSMVPSISRSQQPSVAPITTEPSMTPSISRSEQPSSAPTNPEPSRVPSSPPSEQPSSVPTCTRLSSAPSSSPTNETPCPNDATSTGYNLLNGSPACFGSNSCLFNLDPFINPDDGARCYPTSICTCNGVQFVCNDRQNCESPPSTCDIRLTQACVSDVDDGFFPFDRRIEITSIQFDGIEGLGGLWDTSGGCRGLNAVVRNARLVSVRTVEDDPGSDDIETFSFRIAGAYTTGGQGCRLGNFQSASIFTGDGRWRFSYTILHDFLFIPPTVAPVTSLPSASPRPSLRPSILASVSPSAPSPFPPTLCPDDATSTGYGLLNGSPACFGSNSCFFKLDPFINPDDGARCYPSSICTCNGVQFVCNDRQNCGSPPGTCDIRITQACVSDVDDGVFPPDRRIEITSIQFDGIEGLGGQWDTSGGCRGLNAVVRNARLVSVSTVEEDFGSNDFETFSFRIAGAYTTGGQGCRLGNFQSASIFTGDGRWRFSYTILHDRLFIPPTVAPATSLPSSASLSPSLRPCIPASSAPSPLTSTMCPGDAGSTGYDLLNDSPACIGSNSCLFNLRPFVNPVDGARCYPTSICTCNGAQFVCNDMQNCESPPSTCDIRITQACVSDVDDGIFDNQIEISSIRFDGIEGLSGRWNTRGGCRDLNTVVRNARLVSVRTVEDDPASDDFETFSFLVVGFINGEGCRLGNYESAEIETGDGKWKFSYTIDLPIF